MKEFQIGRYHFRFGVVTNGELGDRIVAWDDPKTQEWEPKSDNEAGSLILPFGIGADPVVTIYEEGRFRIGASFELRYCGAPFYWGVWPVSQQSAIALDDANRLRTVDISL